MNKPLLIKGSAALLAMTVGAAVWAGEPYKDSGAKSHTDSGARVDGGEAELAADRTAPTTAPTTAPAGTSSLNDAARDTSVSDSAIDRGDATSDSADTGAAVTGGTAGMNDSALDRSVADDATPARGAPGETAPLPPAAELRDSDAAPGDSDNDIDIRMEATPAGDRAGPATRPTTRPMNDGASLNDLETDTTPAETQDRPGGGM